MKVISLTCGLAWIGVIRAFVAGRPRARTGMLIAATGSLWHLPSGTLLGLVQISLLVLPAARDAPS